MSLLTQLDIKRKAEEYSELVSDLKSWETELKAKDPIAKHLPTVINY
jgi:hypothetical protein